MTDQARDSFTSLLAYYESRESGEITVGLSKGTVPSDQQAEELRKELAEALKQHQILAQLSPEEKKAMEGAASASRLRRAKAKHKDTTGEASSKA